MAFIFLLYPTTKYLLKYSGAKHLPAPPLKRRVDDIRAWY